MLLKYKMIIIWYIYLLTFIQRMLYFENMKKQQTYLEEQIRIAIKESGMTTYRLAKNSGVPQPVLSRFINAKRGITLKTASKLAEALKLELIKRK